MSSSILIRVYGSSHHERHFRNACSVPKQVNDEQCTTSHFFLHLGRREASLLFSLFIGLEAWGGEVQREADWKYRTSIFRLFRLLFLSTRCGPTTYMHHECHVAERQHFRPDVPVMVASSACCALIRCRDSGKWSA